MKIATRRLQFHSVIIDNDKHASQRKQGNDKCMYASFCNREAEMKIAISRLLLTQNTRAEAANAKQDRKMTACMYTSFFKREAGLLKSQHPDIQ